MARDTTVSISQAGRILGVSDVTLRQWTDEGRIKAFVTPGGHRRYTRAELNRFMTSHPKMMEVKDLVSRLEGSVPMHRDMDASFLQTIAWYDKLDAESRQKLASLGRRILDLTIRSIVEPAHQQETIEAIRQTGASFGELTAGLGIPLSQSVRAFIQHRDPIMNMATGLMKKHEAFDRRIVAAIPTVDHVLDEALVSLVAAHQQYRARRPHKPGEAP